MHGTEQTALSPESLTWLRTAPLREGEIHLWGISMVSGHPMHELCRAALAPSELQRTSYYAFRQTQESYSVSQGGLRLMLASYLNITTPEVRLGRHAKGKPFTTNDRSLYFNISNSGGYCVYAFSRAGEVGVDIEEIRPLPDLDSLIETNFTVRERAYINRDPGRRSDRFFQFWTVKEAYLKAVGEGMRLTPDCLEFAVERDGFRLENVKGVPEQEDWLCHIFSPGPGYAGALVYQGTETNIGELELL